MADDITLEQFSDDAEVYIGKRVMKVAVPTIDEVTTNTCLNVAGQKVGVNENFHLTGSPAPFGRDLAYPPFHWNCRTIVVMDIEGFTVVNDKAIKKDAKAQKKENKKNK